MVNWSEETFRAYEAKLNPKRLPTGSEKSNQGGALVGPSQGEDSCWYGPSKRFEVIFWVYSRRPADYDGYDIKWIQDALVRAKIIPDDKWNVLLGRTIPIKA